MQALELAARPCKSGFFRVAGRMFKKITNQVEQLLWSPLPPATVVARVWRFLRFPYAVLRDAVEGQLTMRAMSLVYTTMLAIVPMLALSFSILKGFGVHYQIEPLLNNFLAPLGPRAAEITENVKTFVEKTNGVALGSVGLALLIYTVISMVQKVEESVNYVWQVERTRSFGRRFSEYLSIILIAPLVMLVAISLLGAVSNHALTQQLLNARWINETLIELGKLTPIALTTLVFSFIYFIVPNTRVRILSALVGGITAGVLWSGAGTLFAYFVANSTKYTAIYSTFAIVIVALIWLYINWLILLLGAKVSFYFQHPEYLRHGHRPLELNNALRERLALSLMVLVGRDFREQRERFTLNEIGRFLRIPSRAISPIAAQLERAGLLLRTEDNKLVPGRSLDKIGVADIFGAVRHQSAGQLDYPVPAVENVGKLLAKLETAIENTTAGVSLLSLVEDEQASS